MKEITIYQVDAFTSEKFSGNPAGVVLEGNKLSDEEMQKIAREMNNSETAFVVDENLEDGDLEIRFFTSNSEVPLCGHATVATHFIKAIEENYLENKILVQKTKAGNLPIEIIKENNSYKIIMTQGQIKIGPEFSNDLEEEILSALGLEAKDRLVGFPMEIASTGFGKVMVGIKDEEKLHSLRPDMKKLIEISKKISCNGYHVFSLKKNSEFLVEARMFSPISGNDEDPVTGNANGPLGAYLVHHQLVDYKEPEFSFKVSQGKAMGRPGQMEVFVKIENNKPVEVKIAGTATLVYKAQINLD